MLEEKRASLLSIKLFPECTGVIASYLTLNEFFVLSQVCREEDSSNPINLVSFIHNSPAKTLEAAALRAVISHKADLLGRILKNPIFNPENATIGDQQVMSLLMLCAYLGNEETLSHLLEDGRVNANVAVRFDSETQKSFFASLNSVHCLPLGLIDSIKHLGEVCGNIEFSPLLFASLSNATQNLSLILAKFASVSCLGNSIREGVLNPLHISSFFGYEEAAALLLEHGAIDPNWQILDRNNKRMDALKFATVEGHVGTVRRLLADRRIDPNSQDPEDGGYTALHYASAAGSSAIVYLLLHDPRIDPALTTSELNEQRGQTALMFACRAGHFQVMKLLVEDGRSDILMRDLDGNDALVLASKSESELSGSMVEYLLHHLVGEKSRILVSITSSNISKEIVHNFFVTQIGQIIVVPDEYFEQNQQQQQQQESVVLIAKSDAETILLHSCIHGHQAIISALLKDSMIEMTARMPDGQSPLDLAALHNHCEIFTTIVTDHRTTDDQRKAWYEHSWRDAVSVATANHNMYFLMFLLTYFPPTIGVTAQTGQLTDALIEASSSGSHDIVELLLSDSRFGFDATDQQGFNALHHASLKGHTHIVKRLLQDPRSDPAAFTIKSIDHPIFRSRGSIRSLYKVNSLFIACEAGHADVARVILEDGRTDPNALTDHGFNVFLLSVAHGHVSIVDMLLNDSRVDVHCVDPLGRNALMLAAGCNHVGVVSALLKDNRMNPTIVDYFGRNALMMRAMADRPSNTGDMCKEQSAPLDIRIDPVIMALIRDPRVDPSTRDYHGKNALMHAAETGHAAVVYTLLVDGRVDVDVADSYGRTALQLAQAWRRESIAYLLQSKSEQQQFLLRRSVSM